MAIIERENVQAPTVAEGDAGIILKADGTFRVFNTIADPANLTPAQRELGKKLIALATALQDPTILELLYQAAGLFDDVVKIKMDS
ncbi:hypothetical protein IVB12_15740 [Bradyrhizobium sp. 179]|uniref:hypothetical protein n=1 Tax=Bradyrhizobium sp. 179 TaxID=2782648 RepID=UPI001FF9C5F5|nr:hypothetical protein [Bradyrhizobium sp. 179]MCK1543368.1 hypothetical protein [Bradyrhizobium sp. 179]